MGKGLKRKPITDTKMTDDFVARVLHSWEKRAETLRDLGYHVFKEEGIYFYGCGDDIKSYTFLEPPPEDWLLVDDLGTMSARKAILTNFGFQFAITDTEIYYKKEGQKQYRRFETNDEWAERITPTLPASVPAVSDVPAVSVDAPAVSDVPAVSVDAPAVSDVPAVSVDAPAVSDVPVDVSAVPDVPVDLSAHFVSENARVHAFMRKREGRIEMSNGQIFEKYSMSEMRSLIDDNVIPYSDGIVDNDDQFSILYRDGSVRIYGGGDDISHYKKSGIRGIIYENAASSAYAGTGITIENLNETEDYNKMVASGVDKRYLYKNYGSGVEFDDWRLDFEDSEKDKENE